MIEEPSCPAPGRIYGAVQSSQKLSLMGSFALLIPGCILDAMIKKGADVSSGGGPTRARPIRNKDIWSRTGGGGGGAQIMTKKRWSAEDKYRIVVESLTTSAETAEICRKYGLSSSTLPKSRVCAS